MKAPYSEIPALPPVIGLAAGISVYYFWGISLWWALALVATGGILAVFFRHWWEAFVLVFTAIGMTNMSFHTSADPPEELLDELVTVSGKVEKCEVREQAIDYIVDVRRIALPHDSASVACNFRLALSAKSFSREFIPGDIICARGRLQPVNPAEDVPDKISYSQHFATQGVTATMWSVASDVAFERSESTWYQRLSHDTHGRLADAIVTSGLDDDASSMLVALLAGDDSLLPDTLQQDYRDSGLAHILAISGLHLTILLALATLLLVPIKSLPGGRTLFYLLPCVIALSYAFVTGLSPSVCRATVMTVVFLLGRLLQKRIYPYNLLCVTVAIWLMINPFWLFSVGFQLSALAVLALIWLNGRIAALPKMSKTARRCLMMVAVPLVCTFCTSALTLYYFHRFPLSFLGANIIASILIGPILVIGAFITLLSLCGWSLPLLCHIENFLCSAMNSMASGFAASGASVVDDIYLTVPQLILLSAIIAAVIWLISKPRQKAPLYAFASACILFVLAIVFEPEPAGTELYITADRSHTRILLRSGNRAVLLLPSDENNADISADALARATADYHEYCTKRHISNCLEFHRGDISLDGISRQGAWLSFSGKKLYILNADSIPTLSGPAPDYLLVCRAFKGDIISLAEATGAHEVFLSADINKTRRRRYCRELLDAGISCRDMALQPFSLKIK